MCGRVAESSSNLIDVAVKVIRLWKGPGVADVFVAGTAFCVRSCKLDKRFMGTFVCKRHAIAMRSLGSHDCVLKKAETVREIFDKLVVTEEWHAFATVLLSKTCHSSSESALAVLIRFGNLPTVRTFERESKMYTSFWIYPPSQ